MNQKHIFWLILLFFIASVDLCMVQNLEEHHGLKQDSAQLSDAAHALETLRAFQLPLEGNPKVFIGNGNRNRKNEKSSHVQLEQILAYIFCQSVKKNERDKWCKREQQAAPELYETYLETVSRLLSDALYFPIPEALNDAGATVSYENSWQYERTYGGTRGHEGCDIMADIRQRGYYPIISTSDGVVENIGWLPKGGYRIGIRSPHGVYYYYAHLAEYEEGIVQGSEITAGQLIGYMGDTGYSEIEGTTGNFPVHLHFGMYLDDADGEEVSYNPYYLLQLLEENKLKYEYKK